MLHPRKKHILDIFGKEPETLNDIGHCVIAVANADGITLDGLAWNVTYDKKMSNSHSCPLNGTTNFPRRDHLPNHYPGFAGRVWLRVANTCKETFSSDILRTSLTYPGTGGGGSYGGPWEVFQSSREFPNIRLASYDYKIFIDDWPIVKDRLEEQTIFDILSNKISYFNHSFFWESDETREADNVRFNEFSPTREFTRPANFMRNKRESLF